MSNLKPRRSRATHIAFSTQPGFVTCDICTTAAYARNARIPKSLRQREVHPQGVPRRFFVSHMKQMHGLVVIAPEAMAHSIISPKPSLWETMKAAFRPRGGNR